ncbi:MAG: MBL fold metallo-hydrolase, partial [Clostridia bacterium]|nr:MBL fold metallo-hydrolase [Clostridia bacterium]
MAKKKKFSVPLTIFLCVLALLLGVVLGALGAALYDARNFHSDEMPKTIVNGELQIHFLELGNKYTGDCTYIKAGDVDILIDAGSRTSSAQVISAYINDYVTDGKLEYVIVTHAHQDHYAGFTVGDGSIFDLYECETIIDFALTNQEDKGTSNMYGRYLKERDAEIAAGATHYTAAECRQNENYEFDLGNSIKMTILDSYYYYNMASDENDHSVCTLISYG